MNFKTSSGDGISLLNNLVSDINSKQVAKRSLFSNLPFEIGPDFKITVKGYNIIQKQVPTRTCFIYLEGEVAQVVVGETTKLAEDTCRGVDKVEIKKAYKFGGDVVLFTPEEQKELKNFGPPGLRIIGFKPQSMLPFWASMNKSTFIYPSEEDYIGSTRVFAALWQKLLNDKKMGIAWYIARRNATPALVAILPSNEKLEATNGQVIPQGLWLYPLPFADDVRPTPDCPKPITASDKLVDKMRTVVQQLQLPKGTYDPSKYPNPALQWHYRILQAMALDEEVPETPDDKTVPKYKQINKRTGEYVHEWGLILDEQSRAHEDERKTLGGVKREREDSVGATKKKVRVSAQSLDGISTNDLRSTVAAGNLTKFTVADLRDFCSAKGLSTGGKKGDLVDRIEQWVEKSL